MNTFITSLLGVALVVAIGWGAGRFNIVDKKLDDGFNIFILKFSLPILLFYTAATANLKQLFDPRMNGAFFIGFMGMFFATLFFHKLVLRRNLAQSSESAFMCSYPNTAFLGIPLLTSIIGMRSMIPIVVSNLIAGIFMIPIALILIEIALFGGKRINIRHIGFKIIKTPLITMSLIGIVFAVFKIQLPEIVAHSCKTIGSASSGVSLFALGLIMSRYKISFSKIALLNILSKNIIQPVFMIGVVSLCGITGLLAKELIILAAMPPAVSATIFSVVFDIDPEEHVSSSILSTVFSLITMGFFMWYVGL